MFCRIIFLWGFENVEGMSEEEKIMIKNIEIAEQSGWGSKWI